MPKANEPAVAMHKQVPMEYPLPRRDWGPTPNGWASVEWKRETYAAAQAAHFKTVTRLVPKSMVKLAKEEGWQISGGN